jgi:hypothetical protein
VASPVMFNRETQLTQVPIIVRDGQVIMDLPDLYYKSDKDLQIIAKGLQGRVAYRWKRVIFTELEEQLCTHYECTRPVSTGDGVLNCGDHI